MRHSLSLDEREYAAIRARLENPLGRPPVPLRVLHRFVEPIFRGTKAQTLIPGRKTPVPWAKERFTLYTISRDVDDITPHVFADGIATYSDPVMIHLEEVGKGGAVEFGYQESTGDSDCAEYVHDAQGLHAFAAAEGFRGWRHFLKFHTHGGRETFRGTLVKWSTLTLLPAGVKEAA